MTASPHQRQVRRPRFAGIRCRRCWSRWAATRSTPATPRRPSARRRSGAGGRHRVGPDRPGLGHRGGGRGLRRRRAAVRRLREHDRDQRSRAPKRPGRGCWRTSTGPSNGSRQLASSAADLAEQLRATQSALGAAGPLQTVAALEKAGQITPVTGPGLRIVIDEPPAAAPPRSGGGVILDRDVQLLVNDLWAAGAEAIADRRGPAATQQRDPAGRRGDPGRQPAGVLAHHDRGDRRSGRPAGQVRRRPRLRAVLLVRPALRHRVRRLRAAEH